MAARKESVVAVTPFVTEVDGREVFVHAGDAFPASSPVVRGRKAVFVAESEYARTDGTPPAPVEPKPTRRKSKSS
jgi:hypothetical protein